MSCFRLTIGKNRESGFFVILQISPLKRSLLASQACLNRCVNDRAYPLGKDLTEI